MKERPCVSLVFRDQREGNFSIERLFAVIEPHLSDHCDVRKVILPHQPSGLRAVLKNIVYARKNVTGLIHLTGDAQYLVPFLPSKKCILTIHDCGYLEKLRGLKKFIYLLFWFKLPCFFASKITVISEATRQVLLQEISGIEHKLDVVENCLSFDLKPSSRAFDSDKPRILQIGTGFHKNLDNLIRAVEGVCCELHIVGKISESDGRLLVERKIEYINEYAVSDERLVEIYHSADILYFASRYEGFGLPILEGQAVGIPVITSNRLSMPWVAGGGALLVDPDSTEEIRTSIKKLIADGKLRAELVERGFNNLSRFTPCAVADKYTGLYKALETARQ